MKEMILGIENNIPLVVAIIVAVVLVMIGTILYFAVFHKKVVAKQKEKAELKAANKAKQDAENARGQAFDDDIFSKREADEKKAKEVKIDEKSKNVVDLMQNKQSEVVGLKDKKEIKQGTEEGSKSVISVLQGKQYEGVVDASDKKIDTGNEKKAKDVLSIMGVNTGNKEDK